MLIAMIDNQLVNAAEFKGQKNLANRLVCPGCRQKVIFKRGKYRIPHFSHKSNRVCGSFSENESQAHLQGKLTFQRQLRAMATEAVLEYYLPTIEQRADVYLPSPKLILEYQCSPISFAELSRRTVNYQSLGIDVVWVLGDRHLNAAKRLDGVAKFARFSSQLGFYIIFYSAKNQQFRIDFQIREVAGKLTSHMRLFKTLAELKRFIDHPPSALQRYSVRATNTAILHQLNRIQRSIVLKNPTYLDMVTRCYQRRKVFVGCPLICHGKEGEGWPIFRRTALCWRVWIVLQLFTGSNREISNQELNQVFKQSVQLFGQQFAQVDDYVRFFQMAFTSFIFSLRAGGYLRHTVAGVQIIKQPVWFADYDEKRQYIMTAKPEVC
ncbi:competence protein CoiA [Lentilactobacillus buchneri]|uniref:Competence protein CoiA n=2 Tax=Lentilactobacillus buchneri TaxID=1581 RepID=J9W6B1_LENBU|nr:MULTISPECIES: competence protein CoiA family protein [Lentilactobacillus]MCC6101881.1 competence protein CoiA [Lactobacillus sp.]AFR99790.1 competence protein CoiA [Lentilactobacillus buchneri subsp. silagei CD034]MCT2901711.1 competence protein CoiA [Lentilactobacillus buchneri]MCT3543310.1 competence protein CoiA [Lentilactobacillus buchneri]MCT3544068.1 competence protein CoiA [Lentilactobacillus buchneri]